MPPKTMSVPVAGRAYFDIGKNAAYDVARRGEIPTIKIGRLLRVPVVAMERMLEPGPVRRNDRGRYSFGARRRSPQRAVVVVRLSCSRIADGSQSDPRAKRPPVRPCLALSRRM